MPVRFPWVNFEALGESKPSFPCSAQASADGRFVRLELLRTTSDGFSFERATFAAEPPPDHREASGRNEFRNNHEPITLRPRRCGSLNDQVSPAEVYCLGFVTRV